MEREEISAQDWENCLKILRVVARDPSLIDDKTELKTIIAKINRKGRKKNQKQRRQDNRELDQQKIKTVVNQYSQSQNPLLETGINPPQETDSLHFSRTCYICKEKYKKLHFHYHALCPTCATINFEKRNQQVDLSNRKVLITGGRVKIGYQTALNCLRNGAEVIVTTRFPKDALEKYKKETDFLEWQSRLKIYGLDLRDLRELSNFITYLFEHENYLDILINNAAQTIKRPIEFYQHLLKSNVNQNFKQLIQPDIDLLELKTELPLLGEMSQFFPKGMFDADGQQVDKRVENSWSSRLDEVDLQELIEVQLVNAIAPFILCSQLKPLFLSSKRPRRFIVNVSAMEGQFNRENKTHYHPHTNMAKAALNMLTRTSAVDYANDGIYMNSVDTGWITDENPFPKQERLKEAGFYPPLDIIDGMARILDPIYLGINQNETPQFGLFLKDYKPCPW